jgi:multidrug efflux pump
MFARFFIDRPIFAAVVSIVITLAGGVAVWTLPLAQFPRITPPTIQVDCNYPGASAQVVAEAVAAPIEQQVNGVENMLYMNSQCTAEGSYSLTVTFDTGTDLNMAQVLLQNRVNLAMPQLPDVVRATGITTRKRSSDLLMTVSLNSPNGRYDQLYLSNYAMSRMRDELVRLPGMSEVLIFGQRDYALRAWVDPDKLAAKGLTAADVVNALREQNVPVAAGQVGQPPAPSGQALQITLSTLGRLRDPAEFGDVIVKVGALGQLVRLKDVARVELGAKNQNVSYRFDAKETVGLAIFTLSDANALDVGDRVKQKIAELSRDFPEDLIYEIGYDTTPFIRDSVKEVFKSLRDAIILVALVVLVFLQSWRSALIPLVAVPVAIVGTFAAMWLAGFSLNNLTLFGLVLAIGIVVDDAIVVVESVEHHIEQGLSPRAATIAAMEEVSGPVIAVGLVLSAVFVPCAFFTGVVGQFFRQFALTIAISTAISTFNSLTLSPALAAILLKPKGARRDWFTRLLDFTLGWFFRLFNRAFAFAAGRYTATVGRLLRVTGLVLLVYGGLLGLTWWSYGQLPTGFIPTADKGYALASIQLPDASYVGRTLETLLKLDRIAHENRAVKNISGVAGNSFMLSAYGSNFGSMFIIFKEFGDRTGPRESGEELIADLRRRFQDEVPEAVVNIFPAPAVSGLGRTGGFRFMVEDRGDNGLLELQKETDRLIDQAKKHPEVTGLFTVYKANSPQLFVDVDRHACMTQGVELADVFTTLQVYLGSRYVNDFNFLNRTWQVVVQADTSFRNEVADVKRLKVRNRHGGMVPLGTVASVREVSGPLVLTRYNMYPAAAINGSAAPGVSTGDAAAVMEQLARDELPPSMSYEWTEIMFIEKMSGSTGLSIFAFSVVFVFLVLAALYESWSLPLAVILVVPLCVLCSLAGVWMANHDINIFTQVGFVVLVGLACKNAILIVEFAKLKREDGASREEAALAACRLRLRPILMTSFAFILGVLPLVAARGAGAEMRRQLGTAVFAGMLGVTLFGIFLTPVFFTVVDRIADASLFRSRRVRVVSRFLLDLLTLGLVRLAVLIGREVRGRRRKAAPVASNGNGHVGNGDARHGPRWPASIAVPRRRFRK